MIHLLTAWGSLKFVGRSSLKFVGRGSLKFVSRGSLKFVGRGSLKFVGRGSLKFVGILYDKSCLMLCLLSNDKLNQYQFILCTSQI